MQDSSIIELSYNFGYNILSTNKKNSYTAAKNTFKFKKLFDTAQQTLEREFDQFMLFICLQK